MDIEEATAAVGQPVESATETTFGRDAENPAVCVVDGFGVRVSTSSGRLVVSDGIGRQRRERCYSRATHGLARLVVMGTTGHVTIEALHWLEGAGVGLVILDPSTGDVVCASTRVANNDARLRRAQALAMGNDTGLGIARYLIGVKLTGQASIAEVELGCPDVAESILVLAGKVADSASLEEVRQLEASAANLYWSAWGTVEMTFVRKDRARVPENWKHFEGRRSAVNPGSPRNSSDPVNSLLNYCYRLLEAEGHMATRAVGLDPGLGVLHADLKGRASFVLDLIETARPLAERHVLRLLRSRPFRWRDFHEDERGVVRVLAPLTHRLAEAMPSFGTSLAPVVEHVAGILAAASPYEVRTASVLTREKHRAAARRRVGNTTTGGQSPQVGPGAAGLSPRAKRRQKPPAEREAPLPLPICKGCGVALSPESDRKRRRGAYCPECLARRRSEIGAGLPVLAREQAEEFARRTGVSATHNPDSRQRRQRANTAQRVEQAKWDSEHQGESVDRDFYRSAVLPKLATVTLTDMARATGMSTSAASKVRAGRRVPHPRHWPALAKLAALDDPTDEKADLTPSERRLRVGGTLPGPW